jgi:hypothetical protein
MIGKLVRSGSSTVYANYGIVIDARDDSCDILWFVPEGTIKTYSVKVAREMVAYYDDWERWGSVGAMRGFR